MLCHVFQMSFVLTNVVKLCVQTEVHKHTLSRGVIRVNKSRRVKWLGHVARMGN